MGYDRGDSFPFDLEPNGIKFGSKSKGKLSPRSYPVQFERKWKHSFLSVAHYVSLAMCECNLISEGQYLRQPYTPACLVFRSTFCADLIVTRIPVICSLELSSSAVSERLTSLGLMGAQLKAPLKFSGFIGVM